MTKEIFDVKVDHPHMFTAQEVYDCIQKSEVLQQMLKDGSLLGEYKDDAFSFMNIADIATIHLNRAIFTIHEIYLSQRSQSELRMKITFDDNLTTAASLIRRLYMTEPSLIIFVVRAFTQTVDNQTRLTKVITIDGMLNNPCTYYNSEGGNSKANEYYSETGKTDGPDMIVPYWLLH